MLTYYTIHHNNTKFDTSQQGQMAMQLFISTLDKQRICVSTR